MKQYARLYPHLLAIFGFIIISLVYFYPVLQGKKIQQSDIAQYIGMAKEQNDFRAAEDTEPYWTNSAFGGMPTYQLGAMYPHNYIKKLDTALRFLPRPADYLFLYFIGFYGLMLVLRIPPLKAFFGALAFGFSTYMIIILGVGHNAKAHAIAYMPLVVAGVIMVFRRNYLWGGLLTLFAAALEISANHFQMTYYLLILLLAISIFFIYKYVKLKDFKTLGYAAATFVIAGILAVGANASNLLATAEYADFSIRGKSELSFKPDGSPNDTSASMDYDYITEYSYGIAESFNLIAPRLFGGSNSEALTTDSRVYEFMINQGVPDNYAKDAITSMPTYWGDQPIVAAPAYIGAVVFFLAIVALYFDKRKIKYAFLAGALISLMLSWGKNFPVLTDFFIDNVPLYDKFRAVSSIQVVLELCVPVLAIMGLQTFMAMPKEDRLKSLYKVMGMVLGLIALLFLFKSQFSFAGSNDGYFVESYGPEFVDALKADRRSLYSADLLRSAFLILLASAALWMYSKAKLSQLRTVIAVGIIMVGDLFFIAKNYVDSSAFVNARTVDVPFAPTPADLQIMEDDGHYRVFEASAIHNARTSYFHNSLSGYSAVRPRRMDELINYQIARNNIEVFNMLNTKYVIQSDEKGQPFPIINPDANGNAWFVSQVKAVESADAEMIALDSLDTRNVAVVNVSEFGQYVPKRTFNADSLSAKIELEIVKPNYLKYTTVNPNDGLAVFSEIYYPEGWNAYIDGQQTDHFRADYVLRAMMIPSGQHTIEFKFEPQVIKTGGTLALISTLLILLLLAAAIYWSVRKQNHENPR
ncbi:MAG: YfhO family protein [Flavobacterium sp.]|nr:YfhO family protein [Flavobacterium sp.]